MKKKFEPWMDPTLKSKLPVFLDIPGPPCADCRHWRPVAVTCSNGEFGHVRLCHADEMHGDFSCYSAKDQ